MCLGYYSFTNGVGPGVQSCTVLCTGVHRSSILHLYLLVRNFLHFLFRMYFHLFYLCISVFVLNRLEECFQCICLRFSHGLCLRFFFDNFDKLCV